MAITQTLKGDSSGAVRAIQDLNKAVAQTEEGYKESSREAKKLEQAAKRVAEQVDPQKKYNRQVEELAKLVRTGRLEMGEAEKQAAKYGQRLDQAGRAGQKAFGSEALAGVRSIALQYFGISQALNAVVEGFRQANAEREKAQQAALDARGGVGELAQLAATAADPAKEYASLVAEARRARASGAADTQDDAARQLFSLVSAGLGREDRNFAFDLRRSGVLNDVGGAATAYAASVTAFGEQEVGSFEDFISKALRASSVAPALANEIPQAAVRAAGSASALGLNDEFTNAATAILAKKTGSAAEGGTQLAAFLKQVEKALPETPDLGGKNGIQLVEFIASLSAEQQGIGGLLGDRAEAIEGFRTLRDNIQLLRDLAQQVDTADDQRLASQAIGLPGLDPQQAAALAKARATGSLEVSLGEDAALSNLLDAAFAAYREQELKRSDSALTRGKLGIGASQIAIERFFGNPEFERDALRSLAPSIQDPQLLQQIADALGDQTIVLKKISDQQKKTVTTGRQE